MCLYLIPLRASLTSLFRFSVSEDAARSVAVLPKRWRRVALSWFCWNRLTRPMPALKSNFAKNPKKIKDAHILVERVDDRTQRRSISNQPKRRRK